MTLPFAAKVSKDWVSAFGDVLHRLDAGREVEIEREHLALDVEPGTEGDVRHLLESAVLEANSRLADDDAEGDNAERDADDDAMTQAFRAFAEEQPS